LYVLRSALRLAHPVLPHVSERIWGELGEQGVLARAAWPDASKARRDPAAEVGEKFAGLKLPVGVVDSLSSGHVFLFRREFRREGSAYRDMRVAGSGHRAPGTFLRILLAKIGLNGPVSDCVSSLERSRRS